MEKKFTAAPWIVEDGFSGIRIGTDGPYRNDGWVIASQLEGPDKVHNAHLMSAGPEMFAALVEAKAVILMLEPQYTETLGRIDAALSKARGDKDK